MKFAAGGGAIEAASAAAQALGLFAEAANPELAALVRHGFLRGRQRGRRESEAVEQARRQKQRDHRQAEAQPGERKLRQ